MEVEKVRHGEKDVMAYTPYMYLSCCHFSEISETVACNLSDNKNRACRRPPHLLLPLRYPEVISLFRHFEFASDDPVDTFDDSWLPFGGCTAHGTSRSRTVDDFYSSALHLLLIIDLTVQPSR